MTSPTVESLQAELDSIRRGQAAEQERRAEEERNQRYQSQRDRIATLPIGERSIAERELNLQIQLDAVNARQQMLDQAALLIAKKETAQKYFIPEDKFASATSVEQVISIARDEILTWTPEQHENMARVKRIVEGGRIPTEAELQAGAGAQPPAQPGAQPPAAGAAGAGAAPAGVGVTGGGGTGALGKSPAQEITELYKGKGSNALDDWYRMRYEREPMQVVTQAGQTVQAQPPLETQPAGAASPASAGPVSSAALTV